MMPRTGGDYVFLREAYGPLWGFLYGWMRFCIANSGDQAAGVVAFATLLNIVTGGALDTNFFKDTSILRELGYKSRQLSATNQQTEHRDSTSFRSQGHRAVP